MKQLEDGDLENVAGGKNKMVQTIGLLGTMIVGEKLDELPMPKQLDPNPITTIMDPIKPPALPGGAEIVTR